MNPTTVVFIAAAIVLTGAAVALIVTPLLRRRMGGGHSPVAATITAVALPAFAILFYIVVSNHDWTAPIPAQSSAPAAAGSMTDVIAQLERRLAESPDDAAGWLLLGRSYVQLQRLPDARRAITKAMEIEPSNQAKLDLAEVEIMLDRTNLGGDAARLVEEVVSQEPDNPKALFYGGMVALQRGDTDVVQARWRKLLAMSPPENVRQILEQQLAQLGPAPEQPAAAESGANGIAVNVSIADELSGRIDMGATLFVLARQPGVGGPPIAAIRASAQQLPASLRISDADAMIEGRTLAGLDEVELVARVSNGGRPTAASGDLFGQATWTAGDEERAVTIVIDQIVE